MQNAIKSAGGHAATDSAATSGSQDPAFDSLGRLRLFAKRPPDGPSELGMAEEEAYSTHRARLLFEQIAHIAFMVQSNVSDSIMGIDEDTGRAVESMQCAEVLVSQLGYLADLGSMMLGGLVKVGDAEDWMFPSERRPLPTVSEGQS